MNQRTRITQTGRDPWGIQPSARRTAKFRSRCPQPCPVTFCLSLGMEMTQIPGPWVCPPSCWYFFPNVLVGISCVATSVCCLLPYCCALLGRFASIFSTPSPQAVADCNKVRPKPFLLQAQQDQLAQPLLVHYMVQTQPSWWLLLHPLQYVHVCLVLRSPELDPALKVYKDHLP